MCATESYTMPEPNLWQESTDALPVGQLLLDQPKIKQKSIRHEFLIFFAIDFWKFQMFFYSLSQPKC